MDKLTIKQTAEALGISVQTVRRRIAKGDIPAKKEMTSFGEMWLVSSSFIQAATHTIEVVPMTRTITPAEISQIIENAVAAQVEPLRAEIALLRSELANQSQLQLEAKGRESVIVRKSFWQRLFGSRQEGENGKS